MMPTNSEYTFVKKLKKRNEFIKMEIERKDQLIVQFVNNGGQTICKEEVE